MRLLILCCATTLAGGLAGCIAGEVNGGGDSGDSGIGGDSGDSAGLDPSCPYRVTRPLTDDGSWERVGPPGGRVAALLALDADVVLAGTRGAQPTGIYRTADGGMTFTSVASMNAAAVNDFALFAGRVYAGVGSLSGSPDDGVWISDDEGLTFGPMNAGLPSGARRVQSLAVAAGSDERVYALVHGDAACELCAITAIYRRDSGADWTRVAAAGIDPAPGGPIVAMTADTADASRVYALDGARVYVSDDAGESFTGTELGSDVFVPNGLAEVTAIEQNPTDPQHFVITTRNGIVETYDDMGLWERSGDGFDVNALAFVGADALFATNTDALRITDGKGQTKAYGSCVRSNALSAVAVAPDGSGKVWVGTFGFGVLRSTGIEEDFIPQYTGIEEARGRIRRDSDDRLFVLTTSGIFVSSDEGGTWDRLGAHAPCGSDVVADPSDSSRLLIAVDTAASSICGEPVGVVSYDIATAATQVATGLDDADVRALAFDPTDASRVFAYQVRPDVAVLVSVDGGRSFAPTAMVGENSAFASFPLAVDADGTVYAGLFAASPGPGVHPELWASEDAGASYTTVWSAADHDGWTPSGVFVGPADQIVLSGWFRDVSLMRSEDGGLSFTAIGDGLSASEKLVNAVAFSGDGLAIATEGGPFYAADGESFVALDGGNVVGSSHEITFDASGAVMVSGAAGIFRTVLP